MTDKSDVLLIQAAMLIREQAPDAWEAFVHAVRQYSMVNAAGLVRSPPDLLVINQGKAQAIADLALTLAEAPQRFEAIRQRRSS